MGATPPDRRDYVDWQFKQMASDPLGAAGRDFQEAVARYTPLGWAGIVKDPMAEWQQREIQRKGEAEIERRQASDAQRDQFLTQTIGEILNTDPTKSLGFQRALEQSRGEIDRSLGASGLGSGGFAAGLHGQAAAQLGADFEQQRMNQLFQALGLNIQQLGMSSDQIAELLAQFGNDPNMLLEWAKAIGGMIPG